LAANEILPVWADFMHEKNRRSGVSGLPGCQRRSKFPRRMRFRFHTFFIVLLFAVRMPTATAFAGGINRIILDQIRQMPVGGAYDSTIFATIRLQSAAHFESGKFFILPDAASPSYCSGATYLVFLKTIEYMRHIGLLKLDYSSLMSLMIRDQQKDGEGVWGRWNANGPGTARLFYELGLGKNFTDFAKAQPGDFMKIFWSNEVGKYEHGHSVIYLGREMREGVECVRYWSSNNPSGYGEKSVPRSSIAHVIFSRLQAPENLSRAVRLSFSDEYLAGLQLRRSSFAEARVKCGF
jgi:hypothetical protein